MKNIRYINAGAGSGKTYTLTETLAELISTKETTPSRVILTTFTEAAAAEFRVKAREMLVSKGLHQAAAELDSALIGTVHSVAFSYVKRYWYMLGLGAGVRPMPEEETDRYIAATLADGATQEDLAAFYRYAKAMDIRLPAPSTKLDNDFWKEDVKAVINKAEMFSVDDLSAGQNESLRLLEAMFSTTDDKETLDLRKDVQARVFRIAEDSRGRFNEYKKRHDLVSFNDMENHFLRLLSMPEVRADIASSVDYVFVDEFQDSSPTQVRIFDTLSEIVSKGSIWVGDSKQAIYDFRGCDTELTTAVAGIIKKNKDAGVDGFEYDILRQSWRSDPTLVKLANKTFTKVFEHQLSPKEIVLDPVRSAGELPAGVPHIFHWELEGQNVDGKVSYKKEYLLVAIASSVCKMLRGEHAIKEVYDKELKKKRALRPSDIAILCNSNEECNEIAAHLRTLRIPVTRDREYNVLSKEVALLIAALNYVVGDTSLLDAELSYLLEDTEVETIMAEKDAIGKRPLFARLDGMRKALRGKPVSHIVDSVIAELDLESMALKWGDGASRKYNLETVRKQATDYEKRCLSGSSSATLGGFINELNASPLKVSRDIQFDGVNVLTYHSSKGLEWGVVILASLGKNDVEEKTFLKREYVGVKECRTSIPDERRLYPDYYIRYIPKSHPARNLDEKVMNVLRSQPDRIERHEHVRDQMARLMYVGATRARDYLITAVSSGPRAAGCKWLPAIGIDIHAKYNNNDGDCQFWGLDAPSACLEHIGIDGVLYAEEASEYSVLHPAEAPSQSEAKYRDPSKYEDKAAIAAAEAKIIQPMDRLDIKHDGLDDDEYGDCIHAIYAVCREKDPEHCQAVAERILHRWGINEEGAAKKVAESYEDLCLFLEKHYDPADSVEHEVPFRHQDTEGHVFTGVMDMLWNTARGTVIVDFKTFGGNKAKAIEESEQKHSSQLHEYSEALKAAGKEIRAAVLFYPVTGAVIEVGKKQKH
jgi:ATP-dependent exoDNAse (exonuclease V) beta subunit